jgi:Tol biopolymer transport system component
VRRLALALAILAAAGVVPATAGATVLPGPNGPFVFTSGRDDGTTTLSDNRAQIWFLSRPGGGAQRLTSLTLDHHRHPSWSPDRTKIAYARGPDDGTPFNGPWDIYVQDLAAGTPPVNMTNSMGINEDRPNWSPDGTRLAYAKEVTAGGSWNVVAKVADPSAAETIVADTTSAGSAASGQFSRPQWAADGQSIFYGKIIDATPTPDDYDIYRAAADGSDHILGGTPVVVGTTSDYQAALSADGTKLCFTREDAVNGKDVYVAPSTGGAGTPLLTTNGTQEYECAWSPDGAKISFVRGAFGAGQILMLNSDGSGDVDTVTDVAGRFDGNPEWTRNPPPGCADKTASVAFNRFMRIGLTCTDVADPPAFQNDPLELQIARPPGRGTLSLINPQDNSLIYTPNANFTGVDTFTYTANDGTTTSPPATVTITVGGPGADVTPATISGVSVFPRRWRRGPKLPGFSAKTGTRIRWRLSEAARVTLTLQRKRGARFRRAGTIRRAAHAGLNTLRFQGRVSRRKRLRLGTYRVVIGATDSAGNRSKARRSKTFRIVAR